MVDYRGVDKQDVINSLKQAESFLRGLNLGPATTKSLDKWLAKDPYTKIQAATNRQALAKAMAETGSAYVFLRAGDIFQHHALVDTNGVGQKIYKDLRAWGALSGAMIADYEPTDQEQDVHLITEYVRQLAAQGAELSAQAWKGIDTILTEFKENNDPEQYVGVEQQIQDMVTALRSGDTASVAQSFLESEPHIGYVIKTALFYACGLDKNIGALETPAPFSQYGIVLDKPPETIGEMEQMKAVLDPLGKQLYASLAPFYKTNEVGKTGIGSITDDEKLSGLFFVATKPAAQAVADQMPQCKVVDHLGTQIMPATKTAAPKLVKKPRQPKL